MFRSILLMAGLATMVALSATGQKVDVLPDTACNPSSVFSPVFQGGFNLLRTADGRPGPRYWQNRSDYRIKAIFDTLTRMLQADEYITYINNSPQSLPFLWITLTQNRFRKNSRSTLLTPVSGSRFGIAEYTEGYTFQQVALQPGKGAPHINGRLTAATKAADRSTAAALHYQVFDTYMKVTLPTALKPGQRCRLFLRYTFQLPADGSDLMGILSTPNGSVFEFSDWYPRMAVYDDLQGWNTANTFYADPGSMDYYLTLPTNMVAGASGQLRNPSEVLSPVQLQRFKTARQSDTPVMIRNGEEVRSGMGHTSKRTLTWHFSGDSISSANWAASASFIWDAACIRLPANRSAMAMTLYPVAYQNPGWNGSTRNIKSQIEAYSRQWCTYPFPSAVNIAGRSTGLAGAGIAFVSAGTGTEMIGVAAKTNHEMGHAWFPFIVGVNSLHNWMCEGFNSFINDINGDSLHIQTAFSHDMAMDWLTSGTPLPPVVTLAPFITPNQVAMAAYVKPAMVLRILRNEVLGPDRFDEAFRGFIHEWAFRHPGPEDFFRYMENASGEDLSWYWRSWFFNDWKLDQAIISVNYTGGDPSGGVDVTIGNKNRIAMPVVAEIRQFNGVIDRVRLPAQIWLQSNTWTFHYPSVSAVSVTLDPDRHLPDQDRSDNSWAGNQEKKPLPPGLTPAAVADRYLAAIGGRSKLGRINELSWSLSNFADKGGFYCRLHYDNPENMDMTSGFQAARHPRDSIRVHDGLLRLWSFGTETSQDSAREARLKYAILPFPELTWEQPGYRLVLGDSITQVSGMDAYTITVTTPFGDRWRSCYDLRSGLKIRQESMTGEIEGSPGKVTDYAQYLPEQGILLPHTLIINGKDLCEIMRTARIQVSLK
ncbi:M1 family aminopeptidase [Flavitalea flava]